MVIFTHRRGLAALAATLALGTAGCMKGPGFLKQDNRSVLTHREGVPKGDQAPLVLESREENGAAIAAVSSSSDRTQLLTASANSPVAGSSIEFPPGALAIDTEITIKGGDSIATNSSLQDLAPQVGLASSAPAVAITSSVAMDAAQPFTLAIPIPDSSSLSLTDPYDNLVVLYRVGKVAEGGDFRGLILRDQIEIRDGFARFSTTHFGTFQSIVTTTKITKTAEVAAAPLPVAPAPKPAPAPAPMHFYYVRGAAAATFGDDVARRDGFTAWVTGMTPARVGQGATLTNGYLSKVRSEGAR